MPERLEEKSLQEVISLRASMSAEYRTLSDEAKVELIRKLPLVFQVADEVKRLLVLVNKRIEELERTQQTEEQS